MHDDLIHELAAAPRIVRDLLARSTSPPPPGEWSVPEIFGHVRAADTIWSHRILLALVHDGVAMPDVDERQLQLVQATGALDDVKMVTAWALGREALVALLQVLPDEGWTRTCTHQRSGVITVLDCVRAMAEHEREHLAQMRTTARQ